VGVGGDPVKGTRFADLVPFYAADKATRALLVIGEIGGDEEEELSERLRACSFAKPVYAIIAGATAPEGTTMGHAGAMIYGSAGTFASKQAALGAAGVHVAASLAELEQQMEHGPW
jgi:succinyl-CoA synthetase alpha subunit